MSNNIYSKRTKLRRFQLSDLENMIKLESDPDVVKFTPYKTPQTLEQSTTRLQKLIEKSPNLEPFGVWAVLNKTDDDFIGWFMLIKTDLEFPEIGFMIVKNYWGMKFATEVCEVLADYGINKLNLPGISARTNVDNCSSIHILKKLGFKYSKNIINEENTCLKIFHLKKIF
jgi:ribosomal-protein-alanine N-acetyltransferase